MKRFLKRTLKVMVLVDLVILAAAQIVKRVVPEHGDPSSDRFQLVCIIQGRQWKSTAGQLRSGNVIAGMGGVEMDLTAATIAPDGAHLRITTVMGGVEVRVPDTWNVRFGGKAIMGANDALGLVDQQGAPELAIDCLTIMGGVQVRAVASRQSPAVS
ncbi:MAG TPA: LiaF domain-containing protein [Acidimicrobiia bacterium]